MRYKGSIIPPHFLLLIFTLCVNYNTALDEFAYAHRVKRPAEVENLKKSDGLRDIGSERKVSDREFPDLMIQTSPFNINNE